MASMFKAAAVQRLEDQSHFRRYKGSYLIVAGGVAAILAQLATSSDFANTTIGIALSMVATVITMLVNRFTRDGITPSMATQLEQAGNKAFLDRLNVSGFAVTDKSTPVEAVEEPDLPVYTGESSAEYTGQHRAKE